MYLTFSYQTIPQAEFQVQGVTGFTPREKQLQTRDPPLHRGIINNKYIQKILH